MTSLDINFDKKFDALEKKCDGLQETMNELKVQNSRLPVIALGTALLGFDFLEYVGYKARLLPYHDATIENQAVDTFTRASKINYKWLADSGNKTTCLNCCYCHARYTQANMRNINPRKFIESPYKTTASKPST